MDPYAYLKDTEELHHAYLIRGSVEEITLALDEVFLKKGILTKGNPDFYRLDVEGLTIDDSRKLADFSALAPIGDKKYICIFTKSMTTEAQNALLKIVEDAQGRSIFFFVVERGALVLPTLESRCVVLKMKEEPSQTKEGEEFLKMSYKERLSLSEKFAKNQDREGARQLVRSLLNFADKKKFDEKILKDLLDADQYLKLSGSSVKGVIGHLALVL